MLPKSKLLAISLLAAVGVTGFAAGAATMTRAEPRRADNSYSGRLTEQLGLSPAQHDSIRAIMDKHRAEMQTIIAPVKERLDSNRAQAREEIKALLTSGQRARYEELIARDRAHWDSAASRGTKSGTH